MWILIFHIFVYYFIYVLFLQFNFLRIFDNCWLNKCNIWENKLVYTFLQRLSINAMNQFDVYFSKGCYFNIGKSTSWAIFWHSANIFSPQGQEWACAAGPIKSKVVRKYSTGLYSLFRYIRGFPNTTLVFSFRGQSPLLPGHLIERVPAPWVIIFSTKHVENRS